MAHPQVQCAALTRADFYDTGSVTVTTPQASCYVVRLEAKPDWYCIEPCPTFPRGRLLVGLRTLQRTLAKE